ncbi:unnamed protein product [Trichogramma brassicae]|uniref:Uncharacterized protein n=1 Tax=Trichogramma brassicae TaxID=86971 RepID=A0A6H5IKV1_9HYME|nr:unnamed protein product [Trichogramma brassicae]
MASKCVENFAEDVNLDSLDSTWTEEQVVKPMPIKQEPKLSPDSKLAAANLKAEDIKRSMSMKVEKLEIKATKSEFKNDIGSTHTSSQDHVNDEDCISGDPSLLDTLDVWDEEDKEEKEPRRRSWDRTRGPRERRSRDRDAGRERERDKEREKDRTRRRSRSSGRRRSRSSRRSRSGGQKRFADSGEGIKKELRRDPDKSNKDIEQNKIKTKKDSESKILAEKEKAIKNLLDSDDVVPPGTEGEAIECMVEKEKEKTEHDKKEEDLRNRLRSDNRRRSPIHSRLGPRRPSPRRSPPRRRSPSHERRDNSAERRALSRRRLRERRVGGRSRSRERRRTRSIERRRSRSLERRRSRTPDHRRRSSRSPYSERRRRRSISRSPNRSRRRSPFINELARQFQADSMPMNPEPPMTHGHQQIGGLPGPDQMPPSFMSVPPPGMMPGGPPPGMMVPPGMMAPQVPMMGGPPPYMGYDACPPGPSYGPGVAPDYGAPSVMYPGVPSVPIMRSMSPQPVPAAPSVALPMNPIYPDDCTHQQMPANYYTPNDPHYCTRSESPEDRMRTPEPPIISDFKICQTDDPGRESIAVQTTAETQDFSMQVMDHDFLPAPREDLQRRPVADRLDWNLRETFDHAVKTTRDVDHEVRWGMNHARERMMQQANWNNRPFSPPKLQPIVSDHHHGAAGMHIDRMPVEQLGMGMDTMGMDRRPIGDKVLGMERRGGDRLDMERGMIGQLEMERRPGDRMPVERMDRDLERRMLMDQSAMNQRFVDRNAMNMRDREIELRAREVEMRDVRSIGGFRDQERDRMEMMRERGMMQMRGEENYNNMFGSNGGVGFINRNNMQNTMNRDDLDTRESPSPEAEEDQDDLQIIEERGFNREPWKQLQQQIQQQQQQPQQHQRQQPTIDSMGNAARGAAANRQTFRGGRHVAQNVRPLRRGSLSLTRSCVVVYEAWPAAAAATAVPSARVKTAE